MEHDFPSPEVQKQAEHLFWNRLAGVTTQTATPSEESMENVRANIVRPTAWFHNNYPVKDEDRKPGSKIALIGGGPSIKDTVDELKDFDVTIACGSAHDWLQANMHRPPTYCAVCDPDPVMANYLRAPDTATTYLIASQCNASVFDALQGHTVWQWHSWPVGQGDIVAKDLLQKKTPGWVAVGGGCTVGLRALTIAMMMGYDEIHFFGFDSCLGTSDDDHHAYPFTDPTKEFLGDVYRLRIGMGENNGPDTKEYRLAGYQLAQADHYKQMLQAYGHLFKPIFHGPGLLADFQAMIDKEVIRITKEMIG